MKKTFFLNDIFDTDWKLQRLKIALTELGTNVRSDEQNRTLLEFEFASETDELPLYASRRGHTGFSKSKGTLFWGLQWIGSFDPKEDIPWLTFQINCVHYLETTVQNIPVIIPKPEPIESTPPECVIDTDTIQDECSSDKPASSDSEFKYSTDSSTSLFSSSAQSAEDESPTNSSKKRKSF